MFNKYENAFIEGQWSEKHNLTLLDNPYATNSGEAIHWEQGFFINKGLTKAQEAYK